MSDPFLDRIDKVSADIESANAAWKKIPADKYRAQLIVIASALSMADSFLHDAGRLYAAYKHPRYAFALYHGDKYAAGSLITVRGTLEDVQKIAAEEQTRACEQHVIGMDAETSTFWKQLWAENVPPPTLTWESAERQPHRDYARDEDWLEAWKAVSSRDEYFWIGKYEV